MGQGVGENEERVRRPTAKTRIRIHVEDRSIMVRESHVLREEDEQCLR